MAEGGPRSARRAWYFVLLICLGLLILPAVAWFAMPTIELGQSGSASPREPGAEAGSASPTSPVGKPKRRVEGAVIDDHGAPVFRADVRAEHGGKPLGAIKSTAPAGAFILRLPEGPATLTVSAPGFGSKSVEIAEQGDVTGLEIQLEKVSGISGIVVDGEGKPVPGAMVSCTESPSDSAVTDASGRFALPTSVTLCTATADHAELGTSPKVKLVPGAKNTISMAAPGKISGTVIDDQGRPITSYTIGVESYQPTPPAERRTYAQKKVEDPGGAFTLEDLGPGTYVLVASAAGRPPAKSRELTLGIGESLRGSQITLTRGAKLTGTITDRATGTPLAGATVRLDATTSSGMSPGDSAVSDDAGHFVLEGVPNGPFSVRARHPEYKERIVSLDASQTQGSLAHDIDLAKRGPGEPDMEMTGVGATLSMGTNFVVVASVLPGGPAEGAGVKAGDRIERIEGRSAEGFSVSDCVQRLRGPEGTRVSVTLGRGDKTLDLTITRAKIER